MSLASTYQACKDLLASKLNAKGITASGSEGLTTLINKVGNLSADGLLLRGDHSVAQSGTTVNLTAVYMENGVVVPWKLVNFYGLKAASGTSKNLTGNTYNAVGCKYIFTTNPSGTVYLDREGNVRLYSSGQAAFSPITLYVDDESVAVGTYGSSSISVEDGYITFDNTVVDCREYDLSVIRPFSNYNGGVISDFGVFDTTDDNGVATATYTCTGAGKQTVKAISGSVQSEAYIVYDCIQYDNGGYTDHNDIWSGNTSDLTRNESTNDSTFATASGNHVLKSTTLLTGDFEVTFQAKTLTSSLFGVQDGSGNRTRYYMENNAEFRYYKLARVNGIVTAKISTDGSTWTGLTAQQTNVTSADCYFVFNNNDGSKSCTFKNVKIYPI